jgi:hypothetical protein
LGLEGPLRAGNATEKIEAQRGVFGKGMAGEVGFRKETETGDSAASRESVPMGGADGAKFEILD